MLHFRLHFFTLTWKFCQCCATLSCCSEFSENLKAPKCGTTSPNTVPLSPGLCAWAGVVRWQFRISRERAESVCCLSASESNTRNNRFVGHSSWCCCRSARQSLKWERVLKGIKSVHRLCFFVFYFLWFLLLPFRCRSFPAHSSTNQHSDRQADAKIIRIQNCAFEIFAPKRKSARTS